MLDRLPAELAIRIIEQAALDFRFSADHRQSLVHLASTSHAIYAIVAPILYHTLIVTRHNCSKIQSLMFDEDSHAAAARFSSYVRVLIHNTGMTFKINPALFNSLESVSTLGEFVRAIYEHVDPSRQSSQLRHLTISSIAFAHDVANLPGHARAHVTHVCGFLPLIPQSYSPHSEWERMHGTPAAWACEILDALPELTHLGLVLVNVGKQNAVDSTPKRFKLDALLVVVQAALEYHGGKLKRVGLRIAGQYLELRRGDIEEMIRQIKDPRFIVWWDERPMTIWEEWNDHGNEDVMSGRGMWTEGRNVA